MKRKPLYILLCAEFFLLLILVLLTDGLPALFSSLPAFPFEQLGAGLRALSLTGRLGNGLALAVLAGISMLPLIPAMRRGRDRASRWENAVLCLLSPLLFIVLFGMANPAVLYSSLPGIGGELLPVVKGVCGTVVWSVAVLWAVLRLLRLFRAGDTDKLLGYLRTMLCVLCALFTGAIALSCGSTLVSGLVNAQRWADGVMAAARFIVAALPYALDIAVTLSALTLLDALLAKDGARAAGLAASLSRLCCISLGAVTASVAGLNLMQLALAQYLSNVAVTADIPVMSLAFVLAALLLARLIAENLRLQSDNDLFI